jgi:hypothetical protein
MQSDQIVLARKAGVKQSICIMPIDVTLAELGRLAHVRSGYPFRGPIEETASGGVLVAQMKDVRASDGVISWESAVRTVLRGRKEPDWLMPGDLLFVARGDRFFATCITAPPEPAVCGPHLLHLRVRRGSGLQPAFLAWQLNQPPLQRRLYAAAEGSSQLSIRVSEMAALPVTVPPLAQQTLIVDLAADAARERVALTQLILNREQQLAAIAGDLARATDMHEPRN